MKKTITLIDASRDIYVETLNVEEVCASPSGPVPASSRRRSRRRRRRRNRRGPILVRRPFVEGDERLEGALRRRRAEMGFAG